jgi:hypothetical protein
MTGIELIKEIKKLGEEKEIIIRADGACEGIMCHMERKIDNINVYENKIVLNIDIDSL